MSSPFQPRPRPSFGKAVNAQGAEAPDQAVPTTTQPPWLAEANKILVAAFTKRTLSTPTAQIAIDEFKPTQTFASTDEQLAIIEAGHRLWAIGHGSLRIFAYAGAGKTSTLKLLAKQVFGGVLGLYVAFNSAIAADARASFPSSVEVRTMHSLARRALQVGGGNPGDLNAYLVKQTLGEEPDDWLTKPAVLPQASWVAKALVGYCQSADTVFGQHHIERALDCHVYRVPDVLPNDPDGLRLHRERLALRQAAAGLLAKLCPRVWAALVDWRRNGLLPPHDVYLKLFELDSALVEHTMEQYGYIMLDESQDLNPVMRSIAIKSKRLIVAVGDPWQQIYSWRGAENALEQLPGEILHLSQSFRFGAAVADRAWHLLTSKPEGAPQVRLRGNEGRQSVVEYGADDDIADGAVVCRTNIGVLRAASQVALAGRKVHVIGGIKELAEDLKSAVALFEGRKRDVKAESLRRFECWADLAREAEEADDVALLRLVEAVEKGEVIRCLLAIELHHVTDESRADVVVSTAHKSKGREWSTVTLWDDFSSVDNLYQRYGKAQETPDARLREERVKAALESWHVAYVAVTRAVDRLILRGRL